MDRLIPDVEGDDDATERPYKHVDPEVIARGRRQASKGGPMQRRNRSIRSGGIALPGRFRRSKHGKPGGTCRTLGAVAQLVLSWRRLAHVPTLMQIRAMAHFEGREPCSYLLDPKVNYVPELPLGGEDPLGRHGLCFTGRHPDSGRRFELVTLPDGCAFDLLGMGG